MKIMIVADVHIRTEVDGYRKQKRTEELSPMRFSVLYALIIRLSNNVILQ